MRNIIILITALFLGGCAANNVPAKLPSNHLRARITYYNAHEDKWGARIACSNGRAKEGVTVAAHPIFDFGTQITIPELKGKVGSGQFIVQDRGTAVTSKRASGGKEFVFDVFLNKTRRATNKFASAMPAYMDVILSTPLKIFHPEGTVKKYHLTAHKKRVE